MCFWNYPNLVQNLYITVVLPCVNCAVCVASSLMYVVQLPCGELPKDGLWDIRSGTGLQAGLGHWEDHVCKMHDGSKTRKLLLWNGKGKRQRDLFNFLKLVRCSATDVIHKRLAEFFLPRGHTHMNVTEISEVTPMDWQHTLLSSSMLPAGCQGDMWCSGADTQLLRSRSEAPAGAGQRREVFRDHFHSTL